ncbi:MAG: TraR/DksA family transcriptional regulator [Saprospiraceae bacterium]|nr:TraR/DksA family transcriptional regulator [Candidatus Vicinibacter affinis]MBP6172619.1 TraR/DksA family transcriptional regulator [Saprospiraceae bacterium]MBK6571055.1 TraR/DksA family transcriptional regulator [Candidatus Vicinibacter affinis]MBK6822694.1 TraR/DksA family transcriptional regulator [Candidatus Vicinibacter affinis]MBK7304791.1 TraR/DksA family transcriptional regulator [Candidatus Vicinibacter affinis]
MKTRYSDEELEEFKALIDEKLVSAKSELQGIEQQIMEMRENMADEQGGDWFDDSSIHTDIEFLTKMAERQRQFVQNLELALVRIKNKSYGICSVTGELIDKQRLLLVPHATKSVKAKEREAPVQNEDARPNSQFEEEDNEERIIEE